MGGHTREQRAWQADPQEVEICSNPFIALLGATVALPAHSCSVQVLQTDKGDFVISLENLPKWGCGGRERTEGGARGVRGRWEEPARNQTLTQPGAGKGWDSEAGRPQPSAQLGRERWESVLLAWDTQKGAKWALGPLGRHRACRRVPVGLGGQRTERLLLPPYGVYISVPSLGLGGIENRCGFLESGALGSE